MTPKADTRQILQTVPRIPAPTRKSPKAARTAGRCDQPGVTCDARLLSCFCPSPLNPPLWAALDLGIGWIPGFQIRTGSGLKIHQEAGRTSPASWCLRLCRPSDFRAETVLRHNRPQRPQHRISLPRRCTDCPPRKRGTQALTGANTGHHGLSLYLGRGVEGMAKKRLAEDPHPGVDFPKLLRQNCFRWRIPF